MRKRFSVLLLAMCAVLTLPSACAGKSGGDRASAPAASTPAAVSTENEEPAPPVYDPAGDEDEIKTPAEAIAEMTWGVNLADLYIVDIGRKGSTTGYYPPAEPFGLAIWFWNEDFEWLAEWEPHALTFPVSVDLPAYTGGGINEWVGGLFTVGAMTTSLDQRVRVTLSDSRIVKTDGTVIRLPEMDREYDGITADGPDENGWCSYQLDYGQRDEPVLPKPGAELDGARFETTVTVPEPENPSAAMAKKVEHFFECYREKMPGEEAADLFLEQGANVIRLPVTWTPFVNDETFEIDKEWLEAVRTEVDYILSKGAYCILNTQNDYLEYSFVGDHWEDQWMTEPYREYVDERFAAIWTQIADYFKDYPHRLIFEPCNEPTMWTADYDLEMERVNELNALFTKTVRATGGKNATRFLCLAVGCYNQYPSLSRLELPDDPDLMVQIHSYNAIERDPDMTDYDYEGYEKETDKLFAVVDDFVKQTGVPVIVGEVGVSHREPDETQAPRVSYFFQRAKQSGVPCLWWEDCFYTDDLSYLWLYDKRAGKWGRPMILQAIQDAAGPTPTAA